MCLHEVSVVGECDSLPERADCDLSHTDASAARLPKLGRLKDCGFRRGHRTNGTIAAVRALSRAATIFEQ